MINKELFKKMEVKTACLKFVFWGKIALWQYNK